MELFGFFAVIAAVIGGLVYSYVQKQKRREAWALAAFQLGFEFSHDDPFGLDRLPFDLFSKGDGRGAENVAWGTYREMEVRVFDYWYYEERRDSEGKTSRTYYRFSCALAELTSALPGISIRPEGLWSRLKDQVGFRDIDFESEEFNRAFDVNATDKRFASYLVDPRMMHWLLATRDGWCYEIAGRHALCYCKRVEPARMRLLLEAVRAFRDHIPAVVWKTYGTG